VNRWLLLLEIHVSTLNPSMNGQLSIPVEQQLIHGVMVSALLRIMQIGLGSDPSSQSTIWLAGRKNIGPAEENSESSELEIEATANICKKGSRDLEGGLGLDLRSCVRENGLAWLPADLVNWATCPPTFTEDALKHLSLAKNKFQQSFKINKGIQDKLSREDRLFQTLGSFLDDDATLKWTLQAASELVVNDYIKTVIGIIAGRHDSISKHSKQPVEDLAKLCNLSSIEASGYTSLTYALVEKMIDCQPRVIKVRVTAIPANGQAQFRDYNTGLWADKVFALFGLEDDKLESSKKRGWNNATFRVLCRRLKDFIEKRRDSETADTFSRILKQTAAHRLWIIPQYDFDKLSVMLKASKHHSKNRQGEIVGLSQLSRMNWVLPQIAQGEREKVEKAIKRFRSEEEVSFNFTIYNEIEEAKETIQSARVGVHGFFGDKVCFPLCYKDIGLAEHIVHLALGERLNNIVDGIGARELSEDEISI